MELKLNEQRNIVGVAEIRRKGENLTTQKSNHIFYYIGEDD